MFITSRIVKCLSRLQVVLLFPTLLLANSESADSIALRERVTAFADAFRDADPSRLGPMLAEAYIHTNGGQPPITRGEWLSYIQRRRNELKSGVLRISRYENQDMYITILGSIAVVTGVNITEGTRNDTPFFLRLRFTQVWALNDGTWQRLAFHDAEASIN